jgi:hypothetical protein
LKRSVVAAIGSLNRIARHLQYLSTTRPTIKRKSRVISTRILTICVTLALITGAAGISAQDSAASSAQTGASTYQPKFHGDPARSDSEANALAYMRVVLRAQKQFNKQYGHFALTLNELVHSGSFTKRMVNTDRGDYTAGFKGKKDSFILTMTPKLLDAQHRSFYAEDDGKIHAEESKAADADSPILK